MNGFDVYRLKVNFRFKYYLVSSSLLRHLLVDNVDLIHVHGYGFFQTDATALVNKIRGVPFVVTAHSFYPALFSFSKIIKKAYDLSIGPIGLRSASKCIALTPFYSHIFQKLGVPEYKIEIIPNGINYDQYSILPSPSYLRSKYEVDGKLITFIGRLDEIKSPALFPLMDAFKLLLSDQPNLKLAILGLDWGYLQRLQKYAEDLGITRSVIFTGKVSEEEKLMFLSASNVGAVVSTNESFSLVLHEFIASGVPVMVSRVGALPWVIKNGSVGFLTNNNPAEMNKILRKLLFDESLAKKMSTQGKLLAFSRSWRKVVDQLETVYSECIK